MKPTGRTLLTCLLLYFTSQVLFLFNIQFPRNYDFDEFHYVPSAKQFLAFLPNQNWEHPPLGKELMAFGIALWGDQPLGWRYMSTVFGALTLVGMYLWGLALFRRQKWALWIALLTLFNQLLYVQARIGMLDTFMFAFLAWALAAFTRTWDPEIDPKDSRRLLAFSGLMFGFATACKWFAVVPWFFCLAAVALVRLLQSWGTSFQNEKSEDWYHPKLWKGIRWHQWVHYLVLHPLLAYFITFMPFFFTPDFQHGISFLDLFRMQKTMWEGQLRVVGSHPYMSQWKDWPLLHRPIWYAFDKDGPDSVRGVLLLGNPLVMWSGLVALLYCAWDWIRERRRLPLLILAFYVAFYASWVVIPRKVSFYYYYYPAGMTLSFALAYVFSCFEESSWGARAPVLIKAARWLYLGVAVALFVYFFPILAALRIPAERFRQWMWFNSWI